MKQLDFIKFPGKNTSMGVTDIDSLKEELPERYEILSVLGQGGIGVVFKVRDQVLDKLVAVKTLRSRLSGQQIVRFHSEARVLGRLNHPNILTALDFQLTESGTPFLVIDYLEGEDLETYVKSRGPLTFHEALPLFLEIVDGLAYAHSRGVIHRDMKPSNVMLVSDDGRYTAKILDFGLSKLSESEEEQKLTSTGAVIGSPLYMSPEQAKGKRAGKASDVYSLGALFYKVLSGRPPVQGETYLETVKLKLEGEIPDLEGPDLPEGLNPIVQRCLALEPEERYQDLSQLKDDLLSLDDLVEAEQEQTNPEVASSDKTAFILVSSLGALAVCVLVSVMVLGVFRPIESPPEVVNPVEELKKDVEEKDRAFREAYKQTSFSVKQIEPGYFSVISIGEMDDQGLSELKKYGPVKILKLDDSRVTGKGIKYLSELPNLKSLLVLQLANTKIQDEALVWLEKFPALRLLCIDQCPELTESSLAHLTECAELRTLQIQNMELSAAGCRSLARIPRLNALDLRHVRNLTADALKEFAHPNRIRSIFFGGNLKEKGTFIDAATLSQLTCLEGVTDVNLENMDPVTLRDGLKDFHKFKHVDCLTINKVSWLPANLGKSLGTMKSLRALSLVDIRSKKDINLECLKGLDQISHLELYNLGLDAGDSALLALANLKSLKTLYIDDSNKKSLSLPVRKKLAHLKVEFKERNSIFR